MKIKEVLNALEEFAPLPLQEDWDNAGLQVGLTEAEVSGVLLCLDVNEAIVDEAISKGCNVIVSHHPLLFHGLKQVAGGNYVERTVAKAIKNDITIISMHTNMDNARGGVNFKIAEKMELKNVDFITKREVGGHECGNCVIGTLAKPMVSMAFVKMVKERFGVESLACNGLLHRPISRVAICGGAGDFLIGEAYKAGADAFFTGEMHYHVYFGWEQRIQICVAGHYQSEQFTSEIFKSIIRDKCPSVATCIAETSTNPITYL